MKSSHRILPSAVPALALAALTGLVLAGCGVGQNTHSRGQAVDDRPGSHATAAARLVSEAARRTLSFTASVAFRLDGARVFGAARAPVFGQGSFDFRSGQGEELIDLPEAAHQELGNERAIIFPGRVYLQPKGATAAVLPAGKTWMSATIVGSESVSTNFPQFVGQVEGISPALALSELAWGAVAAVPLDEELIDHAPAQRYRVTVDLTRSLAFLRGAAAAAIGQAVQQQLTAASTARADAGRSEVSYYVWLDREGRVVEYRAPLPGTGDGTALVELASFGTVLHVRVPAPAQVVDITSLTPSGERENNAGGDSDGG